MNLKKARARWGSVFRVLKTEGANYRAMAVFYLTIVQAVLLYGTDSWTISKRNMLILDEFHKRAVRHITERHILKERVGSWTYPNHDELLERCRLKLIEEYIKRRRWTLRQYFELH